MVYGLLGCKVSKGLVVYGLLGCKVSKGLVVYGLLGSAQFTMYSPPSVAYLHSCWS